VIVPFAISGNYAFLIGASGVFAEIQSSINYFSLKAKPIKVL
jgi:hypothetical protein